MIVQQISAIASVRVLYVLLIDQHQRMMRGTSATHWAVWIRALSIDAASSHVSPLALSQGMVLDAENVSPSIVVVSALMVGHIALGMRLARQIAATPRFGRQYRRR